MSAARLLASEPALRTEYEALFGALPDLSDQARFPARAPASRLGEGPGLRSVATDEPGGPDDDRPRLREDREGDRRIRAAPRQQRVTVRSVTNTPIGVLLLPGSDVRWGKQPPPNVTLDAEGPREWHVPRF